MDEANGTEDLVMEKEQEKASSSRKQAERTEICCFKNKTVLSSMKTPTTDA